MFSPLVEKVVGSIPGFSSLDVKISISDSNVCLSVCGSLLRMLMTMTFIDDNRDI